MICEKISMANKSGTENKVGYFSIILFQTARAKNLFMV